MTAAPSFVVAAFVLINFGRSPAAAGQSRCPPPFPGNNSLSAGECVCSYRNDGRAYVCNYLRAWHRPVAASDINEISSISFHGAMFPSTVIPRYFLTSYAPNLVEFKCTRSGITAIEPYAFANVSSLRMIVLDDNEIRELTALSFAGLRGLTSISLRKAGVGVVSPDAFLNTNSIGHLTMSDNSHLVVEPYAFRNVAGIELLDLKNHGMRQLNASFLAGLSRVRHIVLSSSNGIDELIAGAFSGVVDIGTIDIVASKLRRVQPGAFVGSVKIGTVRLNQNAIVTAENGSMDGDVGVIDWSDNDISCDARLAWIFGEGGLGDGLNETLLRNMHCATPSDLVFVPVVGLREAFQRRGYLNQPSAIVTAVPPPTVATERTSAPSFTTESLLRRLLPQYVARMNSTKNRPRSGAAPHRGPAAAAVMLVASSVLIAMPGLCHRY